jgi:maltose alpha-D-glucosyltransferase/alpha-amylase
VESLRRTDGIPATDTWANFLRNHDELDLSKLTDEQRTAAFDAFGPDPDMQLYERGLRRRMASMLGNDRARIELAFSLMLTLPGTPVIYYGDEIGMGEDLSLPEREPVRTAMQWSPDRAGGFSSARDVRVPTVSKGPFGYRKVNVLEQRRNDGSLLNWLQRAIRARAECSEFGTARWEAVGRTGSGVMALRFGHDGDDRVVVALHNLTADPRRVPLRSLRTERGPLTDVFADRRYDDADGAGGARGGLELGPYGYRWIRCGAPP